MKKNIKFGITMVAIFIWCGMMYPELVFTENVFCVLEREAVMPADAYRAFLQSEPEQIEVKSRVLEWLEELQAE